MFAGFSPKSIICRRDVHSQNVLTDLSFRFSPDCTSIVAREKNVAEIVEEFSEIAGRASN